MKCFKNKSLLSKRDVERNFLMYGEEKMESRIIFEEDGSARSVKGVSHCKDLVHLWQNNLVLRQVF